MRQSIIALVGLSGVGKSTALSQVAEGISFQHLQASALIKQERLQRQEYGVTGDTLRTANIDENQMLLVDGFKRTVDPQAKIVVLDGHTIIDSPDGLVEIGTEVFKALGVSRFIFLADRADEILQRRRQDTSRNRPQRDKDALEIQQELALRAAFRASLDMRIPLNVLLVSELGSLSSLLIGR